MRIEVRSDRVLIDGYVNAVGRESKPIITPDGKCVEIIEPGAFKKGLERAEDVLLLLNHEKGKSYASQKSGTLKLCEDNIGLRASCTITDPEIIRKARNKELQGWSFGMYANSVHMEERADGLPRRHITDLDIFEVSLIDMRKSPCYAGTSVECRSDALYAETRASEFSDSEYIVPQPNYSEYEKRLKILEEAT